MNADRISVVILAAGQSTRFGSQKMKHVLSNGKTILRSCVEQYKKVFSQVTVVIANDAQLNKKLTELGVDVVTVNQPELGMSYSLIAGIKSRSKAGPWLIALGDMPYVKTQTLSRLAVKATANNIVAPVCGDRCGNPVIWGESFRSQLLSLQGDVGAKQLIKMNVSDVLKVRVDDVGVLQDIDRPEDVL